VIKIKNYLIIKLITEYHEEGVSMKLKLLKNLVNYLVKTFLLIFSFLFLVSSFTSCRKQTINVKKTTDTKPIEAVSNTNLEAPILDEKNKATINPKTYTYYEKDFRRISKQEIEEKRNKEWKPIWSFNGKHKGPVFLKGSEDTTTSNILYLTNHSNFFGENSASIPDFFDVLIAFDTLKQATIWEYKIPNLEIGSIVIGSRDIFIGTQRGPTGDYETTYAFAINKETGTERWRCKLDASVTTTLVYQEDKLFFSVSGGNGEFIVCLDAKTGQIIYSMPLPKNVTFNFGNTNFVYFYDRYLYIADIANDLLISFHIDTKQFKLIWKPEDVEPPRSYSLLTFSDGIASQLFFEIVNAEENELKLILYSYDIADKNKTWKMDFVIDPYNYMSPNITHLDSENCYVSYGRFLKSCSLSSKQMNWSFLVDSYYVKDVLVDSGKVFLTIEPYPDDIRDTTKFKDRYLLALDKKTGQILWKMQKGVQLEKIINGKLLVNDGNNLYVIDPE
jgi:outer membrane protein assembly factor BamB